MVNDVSLHVEPGEVVGLLGANGAGKTTTFYMIVGLVRPDSGAVTLDGQDITGLPMYRRARLGIGYLPQEASVYRGLTVERNILASLEVVEPDPDRRRQMLDELLQEFGIARLAGGVRITRGQNQLNGDEAVVNMRTGISTLNRTGPGRVQGLVVPNDAAPPEATPRR